MPTETINYDYKFNTGNGEEDLRKLGAEAEKTEKEINKLGTESEKTEKDVGKLGKTSSTHERYRLR